MHCLTSTVNRRSARVLLHMVAQISSTGSSSGSWLISAAAKACPIATNTMEASSELPDCTHLLHRHARQKGLQKRQVTLIKSTAHENNMQRRQFSKWLAWAKQPLPGPKCKPSFWSCPYYASKTYTKRTCSKQKISLNSLFVLSNLCQGQSVAHHSGLVHTMLQTHTSSEHAEKTFQEVACLCQTTFVRTKARHHFVAHHSGLVHTALQLVENASAVLAIL